jgi:hypothetical protein
MISLSDRQLKIVTTAAETIPTERRDIFLQRVAAMMQFRPRSDQDIADVCVLAAFGLARQGSAA